MMSSAKGCTAHMTKKSQTSYSQSGGSGKSKTTHHSMAYSSTCDQLSGIPLPWPSSSLVAIQSAAMLFSTPVQPGNGMATSDVSWTNLALPGIDSTAGGVKGPSRTLRKRRISDREITDNECSSPCSDDGLHSQLAPGGGPGGPGRIHALNESRIHNLKWMAYKVDTWATMCSAALEELHPPIFTVEADKGFNFSTVDDSFVCQKKNHFQVTVNIGVVNHPRFLKINSELKPIKTFAVTLYGIKLESESTTIDLEQSAVDRSKKSFKFQKVDLSGCEDSVRITIGRLHFSHTTENNMRKKGRPNPEQKYFSLVVGLNAHTTDDEQFTVFSQVSERIIVRASNPSNFEIDCDSLWVKGQENDTITFSGKVGINVDSPSEALTIAGNVNLNGQILQPSDAKLKENIVPIDPGAQLDNIRRLRTYSYNYKPSVSKMMRCEGEQRAEQVGFLAQQVREVLPDAVREVTSNLLSCSADADQGPSSSILTLNKDRIFIECVGALQRLDSLMTSLDHRLSTLESYVFSNGVSAVI